MDLIKNTELEDSGEVVENGRAGSDSIGSQPSIGSAANTSVSGRTTPAPTLARVPSQVQNYFDIFKICFNVYASLSRLIN